MRFYKKNCLDNLQNNLKKLFTCDINLQMTVACARWNRRLHFAKEKHEFFSKWRDVLISSMFASNFQTSLFENF